MTESTSFQIAEYMGTWHELLRYPSFFQKNDNYNTTATYTLQKDGTVHVLNSTVSGSGETITSEGIARQYTSKEFRVEFMPSDVAKFSSSGFKREVEEEDKDEPNYIIRRVWKDKDGKYAFAVVTDAKAQGLWLLSREQFPLRENYDTVKKYVNHHYDRSKFVLTPHYK